jgi:signal transduction histidine kinase/ActR/RegA family two-component response regulator
MLSRLKDWLMPGARFEGNTLERRRWLFTVMLWMTAFYNVTFYFLDNPGYDASFHLWGAICYVSLFVALRLGLPYALTVNLGIFLALFLVDYVALYTGGINSPAMVWTTVVVLPAIMLLGRRAALFWLAGVLANNVFIMVGTVGGTFNPNADLSNSVLLWALATKMAVVGTAMLIGYFSERMHYFQVSEIDRSNADLEVTHQALIRAQAHKDEFIASVGHELRTPMNAILGLNGILRTELSDRPEDTDVVDHIRRSTEQLLQVVNDILDFSQLQAGLLTLHPDDFGMAEVVETVMAQYRPKAHAKGLYINADTRMVDTLWVKGDRQRVVQVLKNLVDNAVKFTTQGHIQVRVQPVGAGVLFEVEDTGIGIAEDRQEQIFNRFEHADVQTNRQFGGTGLGLSICESLVKLQGGLIGVRSEQGKGASFWFQLPLRTVAAKEGQAALEMARTLASRALKILLVDDNAVNLMVARLMLKKCFPKSDVVEASSGAAALMHLRQTPFDVVLLDMVMPEIDGLEVVRTLRHDFDLPVRQMPVLALTASSNPVDRDKCLAAGMNDVINKPIDQQQLVDKMSALLVLTSQGRGT